MFRRNKTDDHACRCQHAQAAHVHYRSGSDCGICGADLCAKFRADKNATALTRFPSARVNVAEETPAAMSA